MRTQILVHRWEPSLPHSRFEDVTQALSDSQKTTARETSGSPEKEYLHCFADGLNLRLALSAAQTTT